MTVVACLLIAALVVQQVLHARARAREEQAWALERRELLTRIQRPELIPSNVPENFEVPDVQPDLSALVGTISLEDSNG